MDELNRDWDDLSPHPICRVKIEQYPEPRKCKADGDLCRLGHPANCRAYIDARLAAGELRGRRG